jgi:hypothetical protein
MSASEGNGNPTAKVGRINLLRPQIARRSDAASGPATSTDNELQFRSDIQTK